VTDFGAQVRAALEQVRTSEPHDAECAALVDPHSGDDDDFVMRLASRGPCDCTWAERVDARLAACVEAALTFSDEVLSAAEDEAVRAGNERTNGLAYDLSDAAEGERRVLREAGLAAFLAAAAQKRTT